MERCGGGARLFRLLSPVNTGPGSMSQAVDYTNPPSPAGQITLGSTWNFQASYRDPVAGGATFNLSDGYEVVFLPGAGGGVSAERDYVTPTDRGNGLGFRVLAVRP